MYNQEEQKRINKAICAVVMKAIKNDLRSEDSVIGEGGLSHTQMVEALEYTINHISENIFLEL